MYMLDMVPALITRAHPAELIGPIQLMKYIYFIYTRRPYVTIWYSATAARQRDSDDRVYDR